MALSDNTSTSSSNTSSIQQSRYKRSLFFDRFPFNRTKYGLRNNNNNDNNSAAYQSDQATTSVYKQLPANVLSYSSNVSSTTSKSQINPAIHPLLSKPVPREENFVLLPVRKNSTKRKRDNSIRRKEAIKEKEDNVKLDEWTAYLSSYAEVSISPVNAYSRGDLICQIHLSPLPVVQRGT